MKTVIQKIGPLYGEAVNGSVFGQPNGSVAVPPYNALVLLSANNNNAYIKKNGTGGYTTCDSNGAIGSFLSYQIIAQLPNDQLYFIHEVSATSDFASVLSASKSSVSESAKLIGSSSSGTLSIVAGTTYYLRARLTTRDGSTIVTGATYDVEGVVV